MNSTTTGPKCAAPSREPGNELGSALGACRLAIVATAVDAMKTEDNSCQNAAEAA